MPLKTSVDKNKVQKCTLFVKQNLKAMDKQSIKKLDT